MAWPQSPFSGNVVIASEKKNHFKLLLLLLSWTEAERRRRQREILLLNNFSFRRYAKAIECGSHKSWRTFTCQNGERERCELQSLEINLFIKSNTLHTHTERIERCRRPMTTTILYICQRRISSLRDENPKWLFLFCCCCCYCCCWLPRTLYMHIYINRSWLSHGVKYNMGINCW